MSEIFTTFGGTPDILPPDFNNPWDVYANDSEIRAVSDNNVAESVLRLQDNSSVVHMLDWTRATDLLPDLTDVDMLMLFRDVEGAAATTPFAVLVARGSGSTGSENCYLVGPQNNTDLLMLREYTAGSGTTLANPSLGFVIVTGTWYWLHYRLQGDRHIAKCWEFNTPPPALPQIDFTDSTHTAAGFTGVGTQATSQYEVDYLSVADSGDAAQFPNLTPVAPSNANQLIAIPDRVQTDGTSFLVYTGEPNVAIEWALTGDGTLTVLTDQTDGSGKAWARYTPGTVGPHNVDVEVGIPV